ncbi:MAG TPA: hypothetical protein VFN57_07815 [Thermomicrobiaceae bacterium]|nr:hypothetical protein [Thermomicrobiaceae bacterium]
MRRIWLIVTTLALAVLVTACAGMGTGAASPTPTPTVDTKPRLAPPDLLLEAASGQQLDKLGSYQWVLPSGFAANVQAHGYDFPTPPLTLKSGETVRFVARNGSQPATLALAAYPQQGNVKQVVTQSAGVINAFILPPSALAQATLSGSPQTWTVNLKPGAYILLLKGTWPSPVKARTAPLTGEYVYSVKVQ